MANSAGGAPWSIRLYGSRGASPLLWAGVVAAAYVAVWLLYARIEPGAPVGFWGGFSWSETLVRGLILGYTPALMLWSRRRAEQTFRELRPALRLPDARFAATLADALQPRRRILWSAGLAGAILVAAPVISSPDLFGSEDSVLARRIWDTSYFLLLGWALLRAIAQDVHIARALSRVGAEALEIDLLDPDRLSPLKGWSLRAVALWVIWFCLVSLFFLGPGPANYFNLSGIVPLLVVSSTVFFLPLYGAHRRLVEAKQAELAWIDARLRAERDALRREGAGGAGAGSGDPAGYRIADLAGYRSLVAAAAEWPFDTSALLRFALYTALGVGSWLGAALVERGVNVLLG